MGDQELKEKLEAIYEFCQLNFMEIQHLKKLLCTHLKIDDNTSNYEKNLGEYIGQLEQKDILFGKAFAEWEIKQRPKK